MNCPDGLVVDHIDGNTLNNRRNNLQICSQKENVRKSQNPKTISGVTGVIVESRSKKWLARIHLGKHQTKYLGLYNELQDAIVARLKAEKEYFGDFAPQKNLFKQYNI